MDAAITASKYHEIYLKTREDLQIVTWHIKNTAIIASKYHELLFEDKKLSSNSPIAYKGCCIMGL